MKKFVWAMLLVLGACSWRSPNSQFYVMNSRDLPTLSDKKISVAVAKVKVPDLLDRAQMVVYNKHNQQVEILEFQRWADVFPEILHTTLTNDLMAYLPNAYVERTFFDSSSDNYSINVEVNQMRAYEDDKVVFSAWWQVRGAKGQILTKQQNTFEIPVENKGIAGLVEAQNKAVHDLAKEIALYLSAK